MILDLEAAGKPPTGGVSLAPGPCRGACTTTEGDYVAVRPSGTEPKIKIYTFARDRPSAADVDTITAAQSDRLKAMAADFRQFAGV